MPMWQLPRTLFAAALAALLVLQPPAVAAAPGDLPIGGEIFLDLDRDGEIDTGERVPDTDPLFPPAGVAVSVYDADGNRVSGTVTSSSSGVTWTANVTGLTGSDFRVEFELDPTDQGNGYSDTVAGPDSSTSVTFASAGDTDVSYGVVPPTICPTTTGEGSLWTTCFVNGLASDTTGPQDVVVGFEYDGSSPGQVGDKNDLGSVWGLAYDELTGTLYTSAFVKRLADLGPEGVDGLYWTDVTGGGTWSSVSLDTLGGPSHGAELTNRNLGLHNDQTDTDFDTYGLVGKRGIGDIDLTPGGRTLLVSNIDSAAKSIDVYDVSAVGSGGNPAYVRSIAIPNPGCPDAANPDAYAPFAIKAVDDSTAYVGVSCTGEGSTLASDLEVHVVQIDIAGATAPASILSVPLDYERACPAYSTDVTGCRDNNPANATNGNFRSWSDNIADALVSDDFAFNPQAMFSDIEIDDDGSLVLGIADRFGHQMGFQIPASAPELFGIDIVASAGELLRACNTSGVPDSPTWVVEGQPGCEGNFDDGSGDQTNRHDHHSGPYGMTEFYGEERFQGNRGGHPETSNGGVYIQPGAGEVVVSVMDPNRANSGGINWFDNTNGAENNALELFRGTASGGYFGKATGIGDVEGCFAPIEIGNYVWLDLDQDGVQDPGELALAGVTVTLSDSSGAVATTTTDANGEYYFDTFDGLEPNTAYTVSFDVSTNTTTLPGGFTNADLSETAANAADSTDMNDSDAVSGEIDLTTGDFGENNYTYDAGFILPEFFDLALQKQVDDGSNLATVSPGDSVTFTITVFNQGTADATDIVVTDYLPTGLTLDDTDWTDNGDGTADITLPGTLATGTSTTCLLYTSDAADD